MILYNPKAIIAVALFAATLVTTLTVYDLSASGFATGNKKCTGCYVDGKDAKKNVLICTECMGNKDVEYLSALDLNSKIGEVERRLKFGDSVYSHSSYFSSCDLIPNSVILRCYWENGIDYATLDLNNYISNKNGVLTFD